MNMINEKKENDKTEVTFITEIDIKSNIITEFSLNDLVLVTKREMINYKKEIQVIKVETEENNKRLLQEKKNVEKKALIQIKSIREEMSKHIEEEKELLKKINEKKEILKCKYKHKQELERKIHQEQMTDTENS